MPSALLPYGVSGDIWGFLSRDHHVIKVYQGLQALTKSQLIDCSISCLELIEKLEGRLAKLGN
jgi:hypothetical protein